MPDVDRSALTRRLNSFRSLLLVTSDKLARDALLRDIADLEARIENLDREAADRKAE
jgi:phosphopantetheine adenylyltransferase